jgi:hypothetical protein
MNGRFGNQLWQIAGTLAVAWENNDKPTFPEWPYAHWFNMPPEWFRGAHGIESTTLADVPECTRDYLQHWPLLQPWQSLLLKYFQKNANVDISKFEFQYCPQTASAVHVRRGDYAEQWRGHGMLSRDYYMNNWPNGRVLVFTDDPQWCSENLPGEIVHISPIIDFMLMRQCHAFVISNSSFAWWSAWLAQRPTVYPSPWFKDLLSGDIAPRDWLAVPRVD